MLSDKSEEEYIQNKYHHYCVAYFAYFNCTCSTLEDTSGWRAGRVATDEFVNKYTVTRGSGSIVSQKIIKIRYIEITFEAIFNELV